VIFLLICTSKCICTVLKHYFLSLVISYVNCHNILVNISLSTKKNEKKTIFCKSVQSNGHYCRSRLSLSTYLNLHNYCLVQYLYIFLLQPFFIKVKRHHIILLVPFFIKVKRHHIILLVQYVGKIKNALIGNMGY